MTVGELLEILQALDPSTEVRIAHQPRYPFELSCKVAVVGGPDDELSDDELSDDELSDDELSDDELSDDELSDDELSDDEAAEVSLDPVVYIAEVDQLGYLPGYVATALGWSR